MIGRARAVELFSPMDSARVDALERRMLALPGMDLPPEEKMQRAHILTAQLEMLLEEFQIRYHIQPERGDRVDRQADGSHLIMRGS